MREQSPKAEGEAGECERHRSDRHHGYQEHERAHLQQIVGNADDDEGENEKWERADPELGPEQVTHRHRTRSQQPERASLEAHSRKDEASGDRREDEAGENQIQERDDVAEKECHAVAPERQELDIEDVHHDEHGEEEQLRPLCRVAEE